MVCVKKLHKFFSLVGCETAMSNISAVTGPQPDAHKMLFGAAVFRRLVYQLYDLYMNSAPGGV